jgi:RHS repeat-associated protein
MEEQGGTAVRNTQRHLITLTGVALCAALIGGFVSPAQGAPADPADPAAALVGGFAVGDAIEALIDERDGSLQLAAAAAGLPLDWSSRAAGEGGNAGLSGGWHLAVGGVDTKGGVRVRSTDGTPHELDTAHPSGLYGYGGRDLVFDVAPGVLPGRDGRPETTPYRFVMHELGGKTSSFDEAGHPVAQIVATELDWRGAPHTLLIRPAANVPAANAPSAHVPATGTGADAADGDAPWRLELTAGRIDAIVDPTGGRVEFDYADGLLTRVSDPSGAQTEISWQRFDDGVPRVDRVRVADRDGTELSARSWSRHGDALPSRWPADPGQGAITPSLRHTTEISDGRTVVRSTYSALGTLQERRVLVTTPNGTLEPQTQRFTYPTDGLKAADPGALPANWSRPTTAKLTFRDPQGTTKATSEKLVYDEFGRLIRHRTAEGATVERTYDDEQRPQGATALPPIGLLVSERTTADDGLVTETRHTLNAGRTAVIATERLANTPGGELERTARSEFTVDDDGFVRERRDFPSGDPSATPVLTTWEQAVDLAAGTRRVTETVAAGTPAAATASQATSLVHGGITAETSAAGVATAIEYDALARVAARIDGGGHRTTVSYETFRQHGRNAITTLTPDGVAVTEERDDLGRVTRITDNRQGGRATTGHTRVAETRSYPDPATTVVTDAWGASTTTTRDAFGRVVRTEAPNGLVELTTYDDVSGRVTTARTPTGALADAEYVRTETRDETAHTTSTTGTRADGVEVPVSTQRSDGLGRPASSSGPRLTTSVERDAAGDEIGEALVPPADDADTTPAPAMRAEREFDGFGTVLRKTLTDAAGTHTGPRRALDELGRPVSVVDALGRESTFGYTPDGLLETVADASGQRVRHDHDPVTRELLAVRATSPVGPDVTAETVVDPVTGRATRVFDPADPAGTGIDYTYDDFGNVLTIAYPGERVIRHRYDDHGRRIRTTDVDGRTTFYAYDRTGLLTQAVLRAGDGERDPELARADYEYDAFGRVIRLARGNGVVTDFGFTSAGEIATETTTRDGELQAERRYTYDADGLLVRRVDRLAPTGDLPASAVTTGYRYDALSRLVGSTRHDGPSETSPATERTEYRINVRGDIEAETVTRDPGTPDEHVTTREFAYSPLGELTAITTDDVRREQAWDAAGNLVRTVDGATIAYDAINRQVARTRDGVTTTTAYWPDGTRRSQTTTDDATGAESRVDYYWTDGELLAEQHSARVSTSDPQVVDGHVDASGAAGEPRTADPIAPAGSAGYLIGLDHLARTVDRVPSSPGAVGDRDTIAYYGTDRHANVTDLTDGAGDTTVRYTYSDYGVVGETVLREQDLPGRGDLARNPFGFAGELTDRDGTQSLGPRMYDAATMRFGSKDPEPVVSPYAFAALNPVTMADPSGHMPEWDVIINGVLAGVGLIISAFTFAMMSAPFAGAPMGLWLAYGVSWAAEIGNVFATVTAGVQLANDLLPPEQQFISEEDSEILTWAALGVAAVSFVSGIASAKYLRDWNTDFHAALKQLSDEKPNSYLLSGFHNPDTSPASRRLIVEQVYERVPRMRAKWDADLETSRLLAKTPANEPSLTSVSESGSHGAKGEITSLTPQQCRDACSAKIRGIKNVAAKDLANRAVDEVTYAAKHAPLEKAYALKNYDSRMDTAINVKNISDHDRQRLTEIDDLVKLLQWG